MTFLMIFGFIAAAVLVYAVIQSRASVHQYYVIPLALASVVGITFFYNTVLGYPTTNISYSKEFEYVAHATNGETIWIWVLHEGEDEPRAYAKPYNEETHSRLESAGEKANQGKMVKGIFTEENENNRMPVTQEGQAGLHQKTLGGSLEIYDIDPAKYLPAKDARSSYLDPTDATMAPYVPNQNPNIRRRDPYFDRNSEEQVSTPKSGVATNPVGHPAHAGTPPPSPVNSAIPGAGP